MKFKFNRRKLTFRRFTYYLLIATIVISCITNGIFAKFTTESDGGDGARVADFGVVVSISGDLFSTAYSVNTANEIKDTNGNVLLSPDGSNNPTIYTAKDNTVSVKASSEKTDGKLNNVVAPGTKNDVGINVSVTGKPETDYELKYFFSKLQTVCLFGAGEASGVTYGLMVPFENGVVNESNFKELVEAEILYVSSNVNENGKTYQNYTKVKNTDTYSSSNNYFKLKDTVYLAGDEFYMPIKFYVTDKTNDNKELLNPSYRVSGGAFNVGLFSSFATKIADIFDGTGGAYGAYYIGTGSGSTTYNTGNEINENFTITWEWPYHQVASTHADYDWCNSCDTILGYIAAGKNVVVSNRNKDGFNNNLATYDNLGDLEMTIVTQVIPNYNLDIAFDYSITIDQVD